jgi:ribosomal protein L40E
MFASQCLFCGHTNPAGAKFCNDCASPMHLKPCNRCDAINDLPAKNCYKCGAEFPTQLLATEIPPASAAAEAAVVASPSSEGGFEHEYTPLPESAAAALDVLQRRSRNGPTGGRAEEVEVVVRKLRPLAGRMTPFFSVEQRATLVVPVRQLVATARQPRIVHATLSALLVVVLALSGYYIYRAQRGDWLTTEQTDAAGASTATRTSSSAAPTKIASPATVSLGMAGTSTEATSGPASPVVSPSDVTGSQVTEGRIRSLDAEALTPAQSHAARPSQAADAGAARTLAPTSGAGEPRQKAMQAAGRRVVPKQTASNRWAATYPDPTARVLMRPRATDTHANVPTEVSRPRGCTEAVAVLGFCNPNTRGENN